MPSEEVWKHIHSDLMVALRLPCKLRFSTKVKVGQHSFYDNGSCWITVNPEANFRVPEHLLLHEAAHHRAKKECDADFDANFFRGEGIVSGVMEDRMCCYGPSGHCEHWAKILCDMYAETGTQLPQTTSFAEFAKIAGIECKSFVAE